MDFFFIVERSHVPVDDIHLYDTRWFNYYWTNIKTVCIKHSPREDDTNLHRKGLSMCQCFKGLSCGNTFTCGKEELCFVIQTHILNFRLSGNYFLCTVTIAGCCLMQIDHISLWLIQRVTTFACQQINVGFNGSTDLYQDARKEWRII